MKLVLPIEQMTKQMPMPSLFLRFIGVCEVFGATVTTLATADVAMGLSRW